MSVDAPVRLARNAPTAAPRDAYGRTLVELGDERPDLVVVDADLANSTRTEWFGKAFPERFFNLGLAEANMVGVAAGLATCGKVVFASTFAIFAAQRALNQIFQSVAYPRLNVKIVVTHAGLTVGEDGATHQAIDDLAIMRAMPNMTVIVPADAVETEAAIRAVADHDGPAYVRLGRAAFPTVFASPYPFEIGKARVLRSGTDVTLVAAGLMVAHALRAAELLAAEGIEAEVINCSTVKPLDEATLLASAARTGAVVTAEEHTIIGGLGGAVAELLSERLPTPLRRVGVRDRMGQSGRPDELLAAYGLLPEDVAAAAKELLAGRRAPRGRSGG